MSKKTNFNTIPELTEDIRQGRMVVMMDDEDRENEGDLIMAAAKVRPEDINFMAAHARGLICLSLTAERCEQLNLPLMVNLNETRFTTNFTVSIEAAEGVTTGISAYDRAHTIRTAVRPDAKPRDLTQPGHVFPLKAQNGGVLTRAGHTEAAVDLAMLAGVEPAGVLVEILNPDGSMARRPQLEEFARAHGLKIGTIEDLIQYRMETEKTVFSVARGPINTAYGEFELVSYRDRIRHQLHLAVVKGQPQPEQPTLVRVHVPNALSDLLQIHNDELGFPLKIAMETLANADRGVVILLGDQERDDTLLARIQMTLGIDLDSADLEDNVLDNDNSEEWRSYGIAAQILADLGVGKMHVLSAPKKFHALGGFGLEVVEYI